MEHRFRLWSAGNSAPADAEAEEQLLSDMAGSNDPDVVHDQMVAFLKARPKLNRRSYWNAQTRRYELAYLYPQAYKVRIGLGDPTMATGHRCRWTTSIGVIDRPEVGCNFSVQLTLPARPSAAGSDLATVTVTVLDPTAPRSVSQAVQVTDRLIASLGDSFASGEGNPDVPSNLSALSAGPGGGWTPDWSQRWMGREAMAGIKNPSWADLACHRSFYNQHLVAALRYAASRPHEAVTFVSYACSGAAVFDGLLVEQPRPPGYRDDPNLAPLSVSQVETLAANLCPPDLAGISTAVPIDRRRYLKPVVASWPWSNTQEVSTAAFQCSGLPGRKIDAVLMSVGGNDVGFSPVIQGALLPKKAANMGGNVALTFVRSAFTRSPREANAMIEKTLPSSLEMLSARLREVAGTAPVIQASYPSPVRGDDGGFCGPPDESAKGARDHPALKRLIAPSGMWPDDDQSPELRWGMSIDQKEGGLTEPVVVISLNNAVKLSAAGNTWFIVDDFVDGMTKHGWCAGEPKAEFASLPDWGGQEWAPWNPSTWDPYVRRARYFRTPNDAALTQAQEDARPGAAGLIFTTRQMALMNSLAGSFHPTFQAHVIMGLSVANRLNAQMPAPN